MLNGCYTAITTPFKGDAIDYAGLDALVDFQIENGVTGTLESCRVIIHTIGKSKVLLEKAKGVYKRI